MKHFTCIWSRSQIFVIRASVRTQLLGSSSASGQRRLYLTS